MSDAHPEPLSPVPLPKNEAERLDALRRYDILDTPPEAAFDRITALAARLFKVPIAVIALVDESRLWFKSCYGIEQVNLQRENSFCGSTVLSDEVFVVLNALQDDRFVNNSLVQGQVGLRFYAGAPLLTQDGFRLGTLCLIDTQPRSAFSHDQQILLADLAAMVMDELELRLAARKVAKVDTALLEITQGISVATGDAFFTALVQQFTKTLGVSHACIGLVQEDNRDTLQTLAICEQGEITNNFVYQLQGTPCQRVIQSQKLHCYASGIQDKFPEDRWFKSCNLDSYAAAPFFDSTGKLLGLLSLMDNKPLADIQLVETLLLIFALRVGTELERQRTEAAAQQMQQRLEQLVTQQTAELSQTNQRLQLEIAERQLFEQALQNEQEMLRVLLDNVQAGIVACNGAGMLTLFNQAAREFHGLPEGSPEQPLPPDQWAKTYDLYRPDAKTPMPQDEIPLFRVLQGETVHNVEMVIAPQSGMVRTLLANGQAIVDRQGVRQGAVVVMHDITARKQMENALRESEAQLLSIFQTIPDGVIILDREGRITAANSAAKEILGLTRGDLVERSYNDPCWSITTVDGQPFPEEELPFYRVMQTGKPVYAVEHAIVRPDGTRTILSINASPLLDAEGDIINVVTSVSDITKRKQAEVTLQESEERYRSVIETAAEGIVLQQADGTIFTCNASAEQILGLTAAQMMGRTSLDPRWSAIREDGSPFPGDEHPAMVTLQTGEPQSNTVMGICKPDGTLTWISINSRPLFQSNDPNPFAVVASFFDITDRKQAEAERAQLIQEQAARLEAEADQRRSAFLVEVSTALAASLDYEQTLQSVAQLAVPYFADWCSVDLLNEDGSISRVAVAHSDPEKVQFGWELAQRFPRHLDDGYGISEVMKTGRSEIAIALTEDQLATIPDPEYLGVIRSIGLQSCIVSPLQARGRVLGSISFIFAESGRHYSAKDLTLAEDLARRSAIAIDNARLYYTAQQAKQVAETAADRTARLQAVTAALSESLTPEQVADVVVQQSIAALGAKAAMVALVSLDGTELEIVKSIDYQADLIESWRKFSIHADVPLAKAVRTGQPQWLETVTERVAQYPHLASTYSHYANQSWMSLPLVVEGTAIGGIALSFQHYKHLNQADCDFILALSRQCAQAISRAQLYEAERKARAEAEQANRVKDEFLAVLSHELRSPLNPILGWSKLLQTKHDNPKTLMQGLQTIERNARLQTQLIEDLLDVSRILRGKLGLNVAPVSLESTIEAAMETVRLAAEAKDIDLRFTIGDFGFGISDFGFNAPVPTDPEQLSPPQSQIQNLKSKTDSEQPSPPQSKIQNPKSKTESAQPTDSEQPSPPQSQIQNPKSKIQNPNFQVSGDAARLQQVVWNLLSNAVKFTPDGGRVDVRLETVYGVGSRHYGYAQITVTDTGQGIAAEFLPHIFERFRQADSKTTRKFGGLGLGLAIVRQLTELHGGTVQAYSAGEGQGATFIVRLPLLSNQNSREVEEPAPLTPLASYPLMGVRILVVDDDTDTREMVMFTLEEVGASVTAASSAIEALQRLEQLKIDVLVSDIGMPEMDGYMMMRRIKARYAAQDNSKPPFSAIALTAYAEDVNQQQALAAGFQRYLSKPVEPNDLVTAIASLIA